MKHEVKKLTLIVNELIKLLLLNGAEEIDINIKHDDQISEIYLVHHKCKYEQQFIDRLKFNLNTQRQSEVEGYYWQLVGEDDSAEELHLVGAMIDEATVELIENDLHIYMKRISH